MTDRHPATTNIARHFTAEHLPEHLAAVSEPCGDLARAMIAALPDGAELSTGLRKLLEAKDCFVRAAVDGHRGSPVAFTINGKVRKMASAVVSYEEIANLAGYGPDRNPTVTYRRAIGVKTSGTLVRGETVEVCEQTMVTCVVTGNA